MFWPAEQAAGFCKRTAVMNVGHNTKVGALRRQRERRHSGRHRHLVHDPVGDTLSTEIASPTFEAVSDPSRRDAVTR